MARERARLMTGEHELAAARGLVVGGNGFIGRHVLRYLLAAGTEVAVMDVTAPEAGLDWITGSVTDEPRFASAVSG